MQVHWYCICMDSGVLHNMVNCSSTQSSQYCTQDTLLWYTYVGKRAAVIMSCIVCGICMYILIYNLHMYMQYECSQCTHLTLILSTQHNNHEWLHNYSPLIPTPKRTRGYSCVDMWRDLLCRIARDHFQWRADEVLQAHDKNHNGEDKLQKVLHCILPSNPLSSAPVEEVTWMKHDHATIWGKGLSV